MSDDFEIPRASDGKRLRRGDSPILASEPEPLARRSATDLKATLLADAGPIWPAARKLVQAENWFILHPGHAADAAQFAAVSKRAMELTGVCFRGRLSGGNALLAYVVLVAGMDDDAASAERQWWRHRWVDHEPFDLDPGDPVGLWRAVFPCPHALGAIAHMMMGWSPWWPTQFGRDPPACRFRCMWNNGLVSCPCLDTGPRVRLTPDA